MKHSLAIIAQLCSLAVMVAAQGYPAWTGSLPRFKKVHVQGAKKFSTITPFNNQYSPSGGGSCPVTGELDRDAILSMHNDMRATAGAAPLTWGEDLAQVAQCWANRCQFEHSHTQGMGENIACGNGDDYKAADGIQQWWDEWKLWAYGMDFTEETGHFTQMAWKDTRRVGCGVASCASSTLGLESAGYYPHASFLVCEYDPPGNYLGHFDGEVVIPSDSSAPSGWTTSGKSQGDTYGWKR